MISTNMEKWLKALRSGSFWQTHSVLYDGEGYCCLGVADIVCFNAEFKQDHWGDWVDDTDRSSSLADKRANKLGLHTKLTIEERNSILKQHRNLKNISGANDRQDILMRLNDSGYTFTQIADVIEKYGWDKEAVNA